MIRTMELADFSPQLNQKFRLQTGPSASLEVELIEVKELGSGVEDRRRSLRGKPFSLVFRGPNETPLAQGTYTIEHETAGTLELFLVPIGPDKEGLSYEAIFN